MSKLMRVTPNWKSVYYWMAMTVFLVLWAIVLVVFEPTTFTQKFVLWLPCTAVFLWLVNLAKKAQFEADWTLPKTPRIPIE